MKDTSIWLRKPCTFRNKEGHVDDNSLVNVSSSVDTNRQRSSGSDRIDRGSGTKIETLFCSHVKQFVGAALLAFGGRLFAPDRREYPVAMIQNSVGSPKGSKAWT